MKKKEKNRKNITGKKKKKYTYIYQLRTHLTLQILRQMQVYFVKPNSIER